MKSVGYIPPRLWQPLQKSWVFQEIQIVPHNLGAKGLGKHIVF